MQQDLKLSDNTMILYQNMKNYFIGKNIADKRNERGISVETAAKYLGISIQDLLLYETGEKEIDYAVLVNLSEFFNVSIDSFFSYIKNFSK